MARSRHTGLIVSSVIVVAVGGTLGALLWIRSERIWLEPHPPEVTFSFRVNGAKIDSPEFREVLNAVNAVVFQRSLILPRTMIMGTTTLSTHAYYSASGTVPTGTHLETELPRIRDEIGKLLAAKGVRASWRLAVIAPDGRVTTVD